MSGRATEKPEEEETDDTIVYLEGKKCIKSCGKHPKCETKVVDGKEVKTCVGGGCSITCEHGGRFSSRRKNNFFDLIKN